MVEKYGIFGNFILENNLVELSHNETFVWPNIIDLEIETRSLVLLFMSLNKIILCLNTIKAFQK